MRDGDAESIQPITIERLPRMHCFDTYTTGPRAPVIRALACATLALVAAGAGNSAWAQSDAAPSPPIASTFIYDANLQDNLRGGAAEGHNYQGLLRWQTSIDAKRSWGWQTTSAFINVMAAHRAGRAVLAGDAQGVDNIAAPSGVRVEEAWVQRNFLDGALSVLVGRYDLNSEFYRLNSAGLFLNSSFGIGPEFSASGQGGPSIYPATSLGGRIAFKPAANVILRAAVLDGAPVDRDGAAVAPRRADGALLIAEVAWLARPAPAGPPRDRRFLIGRSSGISPYQDKLAIGGWHYTAAFADLNDVDGNGAPVRRRGSSGAYLLADKLLYQSAAPDAGKLAGFIQLGAASARVNRFDAYLGTGIVGTGFVPGRPDDEIGLAVAAARNGHPYLLGQAAGGLAPMPRRAETTIELAYLGQVSPHLSLAPNLQYVIHPDTVAGRPRALTFQLRAELAY